MLRIVVKSMGKPPAKGPEPQDSPDKGSKVPMMPGGSDADSPDQSSEGGDTSKVSQDVAVYLGPEYGPFECANCHHFSGQGSCDIVQGPVDASGCCNLFSSLSHESEDEGGEESPEHEAAESPEEEAAEQASGDEDEGQPS